MKYKRKNILYKWIVLMGLLQGTTTAQTPVDAVCVVLSNFNLVPEPSSLALLGVGAVFLLRRRKSY